MHMITTNIIDRQVNRNENTNTFLMILIFNLVTFQTLTFLLFAFLENLSVAQILAISLNIQWSEAPPPNIHKISVVPVSKFY